MHAPPTNSTTRLRQVQTTPCAGCGNHFIHSKNCINAKPGSSHIFKWPADSADN